MDAPSLYERICGLDPQEAGALLRNSCRIAQVRACAVCHGGGVKLAESGGAYARAEVCDCIRQCPQCQGRAFYEITRDGKGPRRVRRCMDPAPSFRAGLISLAQIPLRYARARLSELDSQSRDLCRIAELIRGWLKQLGPGVYPERGFILQGGVGVGKTYLVAAAAKHLAHRGYRVRFVDFFQLITEIKMRHARGEEWQNSLFRPLLEVDFLIIDELGKGRRTEFELTVIDQLVAQRYNRRRVILATTNCLLTATPVGRPDGATGEFADDLMDLKTAVGSRVFSRLVEMCEFWPVHKAEDLRLHLLARRPRP